MIEKFEVGKWYAYKKEEDVKGLYELHRCEAVDVTGVMFHGESMKMYYPITDGLEWKKWWNEVYNYKGKWLVVGRKYWVWDNQGDLKLKRTFAFVHDGVAYFWFQGFEEPHTIIGWKEVMDIEDDKPVIEYHLVKTENGEEKSRTKLTDDQRKELGI